MAGGWLFLAAYTCSGLAGLIYEVTWTRLLTLYMGHTIPAASTVAAAFMGGLGIGSAVGGRIASRLSARQALFGYAALELIIVAAAIAIPFSLSGLAAVISWPYADGSSAFLFPLVRFSGCVGVLLLPSMALGATFPMAVRASVIAPSHGGSAAGRLYTANTAGAALGSFAAGLLLIPTIGVAGTTLVGVAASSLSIAMVWILAYRRPANASGAVVAAQASSSESKLRSASRRGRIARSRPERHLHSAQDHCGLAAVILALTGFATFMSNRVDACVLDEPRTFDVCLRSDSDLLHRGARGRVVCRRGGRETDRTASLRPCDLARMHGHCSRRRVVAGRRWLPHYVVETGAMPGYTVSDLFMRHALVILALVAPTAFGLGFAFPLSLELAGHGAHSLAHRMGTVYSVNTIAAVAGALTAGFAAIPLLGLQRTLLLATMVLLVGVGLLVARAMATVRERLTAMVPATAACAWLILSPQWDRQLLASGAYMYTRVIPNDLDIETALKAGTLLYYREGASGTVSVKRLAGDLSLAIDGKVDASNAGDMLTQRLLGLLPLLLHRIRAKSASSAWAAA